MKLKDQVRPISYLKANAADLIRKVSEGHPPYVITQNGEAKAVVQGLGDYEETQETMALLKILALGNEQVESGKVVLASSAIKRLRKRSTTD